MQTPGEPQPLDYARPDAERLPNSRIIVQRGPNWIRFIDPPLGSVLLFRRVLIDAVLKGFFALVVLAVCVISWRLSYLTSILVTLGVALPQVWASIRWWFGARKNPTIIDIFADQLIVLTPSRKRIVIPRDQLSDIHAATPRQIPGVRGRVSSLRISWTGRRIRLLQLRDYIEIRWLARQIRRVLGEPVDHPLEPSPREIDAQDASPEIEVPVLSVAPPRRFPAKKRGTLSRFGDFLRREIDQLETLSFLLMMVLILGGFWTAARAIPSIDVWLRFGSHALHDPGFQPLPHRRLTLVNGRQIPNGYDTFATMVVAFVVMPPWIVVAVLIAIGVNRVTSPILKPWSERRLKRKMDRIYTEHMRIKAQREAELPRILAEQEAERRRIKDAFFQRRK